MEASPLISRNAVHSVIGSELALQQRRYDKAEAEGDTRTKREARATIMALGRIKLRIINLTDIAQPKLTTEGYFIGGLKVGDLGNTGRIELARREAAKDPTQ